MGKEKIELSRTDAFLKKYFEICKSKGIELNGLDRARFTALLKSSPVIEEVLGMAQVINDYEKEQEDRKLVDELLRLQTPKPKEEPIKGPVLDYLPTRTFTGDFIGQTENITTGGKFTNNSIEWDIKK